MLCELIKQHPDFRSLRTIAGIAIDLRYAGDDNFVGHNLYAGLDCAWLHRDAAQGLAAAAAQLQQQRPGHTLLVLDALRPQRVQEMLWKHLEGSAMRMYVADPARGSIHSFGMAVDVTVLDEQGRELDMGTHFDEFTVLSHPVLEQKHLEEGSLTSAQIANRLILRNAMFDSGFRGINSEWWHFNFGDPEVTRQTYIRID
jgi:D-alanyl-D-alanine dipeptidase